MVGFSEGNKNKRKFSSCLKIYWNGDASCRIFNNQNFKILWSKFQYPLMLWYNRWQNQWDILVVLWRVLKEAVISSETARLPRTHSLSRTCHVWITSWFLLNLLSSVNVKYEGWRIIVAVMVDSVSWKESGSI